MPAYQFGSATAAEAGFSGAVLAELDAYFDTMVANGELPGHVMLLVRGDKVVRGHVTGFADCRDRRPLTADAIFTLFSMSKPLAAVAMLLLHEEGKWQFDDSVADYLPEFRDIASLPGSGATRPPTIRELFTHSAGFSLGRTVEEMQANVQKLKWHDARSLTEQIGRYAAIPLGYEPGTAWEYSVATDLQAEIVERLSGERYDLFLKKRVFDPLGMTDTGFTLDYDRTRRLVCGHVLDPETGRLRAATPEERMESIFPMGGTSFKSTAQDYARFARMLLQRGTLGEARILKPESVALMLANHLPDGLLENRYPILHYAIGQGNGHGLNGMVCLDPARAGRPVGTGTYEWGGAFGTWFWIDPEHDILCIGMTHRQRIQTDLRPPEIVAQEFIYRALREGAAAHTA
ncbi:CubicO group peptidase (beta-lactamase class C family) [Sphingopyxis panaciterrae]|uniref:serine hydrolase domain-containing protein n=1 Tax=Sphingopyxis panaciterrae TaxID=363841 RepID=UPI001423111A|nr:serine hydrolase domain-containing protein [Sphingopyxis panaciterrae]NIJ38708.1 CubicO group peptidase (beta-lactamase class C family) [Sphingopyxis panaciterrae]